MSNWGFAGGPSFISNRHDSIYPSIDPTKLTLPTKAFTVCIVGASRGIGAGIATAYAKAGASGLVLASRRISGLEETAVKCREVARNKDLEVHIVPCDITKAEDVEALATKTRQLFGGRLDVLALNSGASGDVYLKLHQVPVEQFEQTTKVNYFGTFYCAKYFIPLLLARSSESGGDEEREGAKTFAVVSSWASLIVRGPIANAQYCNSKGAQLKLAEHLHEEYFAEGLKVYAVHPGAVASEGALQTAPEEFKKFLGDSPDLCGAVMAWLSSGAEERKWLAGRLLDAKWDVEDLERRKGEVIEGDLLKIGLRLGAV